MLAKMWKKVLLAVCIVACIFNLMSKLVNRHSLKDNLESVNDGTTVFNIFKKDDVAESENSEIIDGVINTNNIEENEYLNSNETNNIEENTEVIKNEEITNEIEEINEEESLEEEAVTEKSETEEKSSGFKFSDFTIIF